MAVERQSDPFDHASAIEQQALDDAIERARTSVKEIKFTGKCIYCAAPLNDRRFCDAQCRDDWEYEQDCKQRS